MPAQGPELPTAGTHGGSLPRMTALIIGTDGQPMLVICVCARAIHPVYINWMESEALNYVNSLSI